MVRLPRLVLPGLPYHVTQRGNRRQQTFFKESDYALYRDLLAEAARKAGTEIWCYCLAPKYTLRQFQFGDSLLNTLNSYPSARRCSTPADAPCIIG